MRALMRAQQVDNQYHPWNLREQMMLAKHLSYPRLLSMQRCIDIGVDSQYSYLHGSNFAFKSYDTFISGIDQMACSLSLWQGKRFSGNTAENLFARGVKYWTRDPLAVLQEILENKALANKCVWEPVKVINSEGERVYTDLHDSAWWWDLQVAPSFTQDGENRTVFHVEILDIHAQ